MVQYVPFLSQPHLSDVFNRGTGCSSLIKRDSLCYFELGCQRWPLTRLELILLELSGVV